MDLIREAFEILDLSDEPDRGIQQYRALLVKKLSYLYYDDSAMALLESVLGKYYYKIRKEASYREFISNMSEKLDLISDENVRRNIKKYLIDFKQEVEALSSNEGIVYVVNYEKQFGFFQNQKYPQGVYFKLTPKVGKVQLGDIVQYDCIIETKQGIMASSIIRVR